MAVLAIAFLASRVPFLNSGFGDDMDAWMMANSAYDLATEHVYHTSRAPGYPLPEYVDSLIIQHGWLATNAITMVLSLASVIVFAKILKRIEAPNKGLLVVTYAFLPILWVNSTNAMDYMWALTFVMFTWLFALRKQWCVAGLAMGLAVGSRMTSAALMLPFLYLLATQSEGHRIKNAIFFLAISGTVSAALFWPLFDTIQQYAGSAIGGERALEWVDPNRFVQIQDEMAHNFGLLPAVLAGVLLLCSSRMLYRRLVALDRTTVFSVLAILMVTVMFVLHPVEGEYVIPAIPFGLVLLGNVVRRDLLVILCVFLLLSSYVSFNVVRNARGYPALTTAPGIVGQDMRNRGDNLAFNRGILDAELDHAIVVVDWNLAVLHYLNERDSRSENRRPFEWEEGDLGLWDFDRDVFYSHALPLEDLQDFQSRGYTVYYVLAIRDHTYKVYGYDLHAYGGIYLEVPF